MDVALSTAARVLCWRVEGLGALMNPTHCMQPAVGQHAGTHTLLCREEGERGVMVVATGRPLLSVALTALCLLQRGLPQGSIQCELLPPRLLAPRRKHVARQVQHHLLVIPQQGWVPLTPLSALWEQQRPVGGASGDEETMSSAGAMQASSPTVAVPPPAVAAASCSSCAERAVLHIPADISSCEWAAGILPLLIGEGEEAGAAALVAAPAAVLSARGAAATHSHAPGRRPVCMHADGHKPLVVGYRALELAMASLSQRGQRHQRLEFELCFGGGGDGGGDEQMHRRGGFSVCAWLCDAQERGNTASNVERF